MASKIRALIGTVVLGGVALALLIKLLDSPSDIKGRHLNSQDSKRVSQMQTLVKSEAFDMYAPDIKVNLLRYYKDNNIDSMIYMSKKLEQMEKEQKFTEKIKGELEKLKDNVDDKEYGQGIDLAKKIRKELKEMKFQVLSLPDFASQVDNYEAELFKLAGRSM